MEKIGNLLVNLIDIVKNKKYNYEKERKGVFISIFFYC